MARHGSSYGVKKERGSVDMMRIASLLACTLVFSGCTFDYVKRLPADATASTGTVSTAVPTRWIVLGPVTMPPRSEWSDYKPSWDNYLPDFERGFREWVERNGRGEWAVAAPGMTPPAEAVQVRVTGEIYRLTVGVEALRLFVGMGAGQAKVGGIFQVADQSGAILDRFRARESYLGGLGAGGFDYISMETLVRRFSETVAEEVVERSDAKLPLRSAASGPVSALPQR
jgi:hypothetical protein